MTMLYPNLFYNEVCYKGTELHYSLTCYTQSFNTLASLLPE